MTDGERADAETDAETSAEVRRLHEFILRVAGRLADASEVLGRLAERRGKVKPYYEDGCCTLYCGDCREIMPSLEPGSIDCVITDPVWPNAVADLVGSDDPAGLFAGAAAHFPRLTSRVVVQMGVDSDPRFLAGVPACLPFLRACWLEYALARPKGRILYSGDVAYIFGSPPAYIAGRQLVPGRMVSARPDRQRPRRRASERKAFEGRWTMHPCPRRLEHVNWLVCKMADGKILDPFAGSGTTLRAAKNQGLPSIGVEIEECYCEVAAKRLSQGVFDFAE
jgi:hypothetical protein